MVTHKDRITAQRQGQKRVATHPQRAARRQRAWKRQQEWALLSHDDRVAKAAKHRAEYERAKQPVKGA
jgi:hypothetical protein